MRGEDRHANVIIDLANGFQGATRKITLQVSQVDAHGRVASRAHTLNILIPKGIKAGQHIRLAGQGSPGVGGDPAGDLYLEIHFTPGSRYRVEGRDVHQNVPVTPWEAALRASIETPTLWER